MPKSCAAKQGQWNAGRAAIAVAISVVAVTVSTRAMSVTSARTATTAMPVGVAIAVSTRIVAALTEPIAKLRMGGWG